MSKEILYWGVEAIADRVGVNKNLAREWIRTGAISAKKTKGDKWFITESQINEDINRMMEGGVI